MFTKRTRILASLFLVLLACAATALFLHFRKPALPPAIPADLAMLNLQLQLHLSGLIEAVKRSPRDSDAHINLAIAYAANSIWPSARQEFESVLILAPKEPLAHVYLAVAHLELGDAQASISILRHATTQFPNCAPAWQRLGDLLLRRGLPGEAEQAFQHLIALAPGEWRGYSGVGQVKLQEGRSSEARDSFLRALQHDPRASKAHFLLGTALQQLGETNTALIELCLGANAQDTPMSDPWAERAPAHMKNTTDMLEMARDMREHGAMEEAMVLLQNARKYQPTNATLLNNLAITYNQMNRPDLALPLLQEARERNSQDANFALSLSYTLQLLGQNAEALRTADELITRIPTLTQAYLAKANASLALENDSLAVATLRKASEMDPRNEGILIELGDVLWKNLEQPDAAIECYQKALQLKPCAARAFFAMAQLHQHLGNNDLAEAYSKKAQQIARAEGSLSPTALSSTRNSR